MTGPTTRVSGAPLKVVPGLLSRVLLADDEPALARAYANYLRSCGYIVEVVEDGTAAVERFTNARFDVIVADFKMPGLDGLALLELVRQKEPELPVILTTASPSLQVSLRARHVGAFQCLSKPFALGDLGTTVALAVEHGRLARSKAG